MGFMDSIRHALTEDNSPVHPRITAPPSEPGSAMSEEQLAVLAPSAREHYQAASLSIRKRGLLGERAAVYTVVDRSASMSYLWSSGAMGQFMTKALALSAHFDDDGTVPVFGFGSRVSKPIDIDLSHAESAVTLIDNHCGPLQSSTLYAPAIRAVVKHHLNEVKAKSRQSSQPPAPGFVIFQTDGAASDPEETVRALIDASRVPIFFQFVGFGGTGPESFPLLNELDELQGRLVDNAGFFWAGTDPAHLSDGQLYDGLMNEFPEYLESARKVFSR